MYLPVHSINYWISTIAKIPSTEQDGEFNVMSMGRNGSSWPGHWISTIAKIPSTEQDGEFNVMSMGRNGSSLAWLTNYEKYMECWHVFHLTCMLEWLQQCHDNGWCKSCPVCRTHCGELYILV
jgi:hypothetical protein